MKVKDAMKKIEIINKEVKNLEKLCLLSREDRENIAKEAGLDSSFENMVNVSVNAMLSWKNTLKEKIDNATIN